MGRINSLERVPMRKRFTVVVLSAIALFVIAGSAAAAVSQSAVIFDSTSKTGPKANAPSYGLEASSAAQIGGRRRSKVPSASSRGLL